MPTIVSSSTPIVKKKTSYVAGNIPIAIINHSTVLTDTQVRAVIPSLQTQVSRDFSPVWGMNAILGFYSKNTTVPKGSWLVYIVDDADVSGALGYHDDTPTGTPVTYVFARTTMQYGMSWTVTLSHEILEMLVDPWIILTVFEQTTNKTGRLWAYEVGDPCEADQCGYKIGNVLVSDFVFPTWFHPEYYGPTPRYDFMNYIKSPLTLATGGYAIYFDVGSGSGWQNIWGRSGKKAESRVEECHRHSVRTNRKS